MCNYVGGEKKHIKNTLSCLLWSAESIATAAEWSSDPWVFSILILILAYSSYLNNPTYFICSSCALCIHGLHWKNWSCIYVPTRPPFSTQLFLSRVTSEILQKVMKRCTGWRLNVKVMVRGSALSIVHPGLMARCKIVDTESHILLSLSSQECWTSAACPPFSTYHSQRYIMTVWLKWLIVILFLFRFVQMLFVVLEQIYMLHI